MHNAGCLDRFSQYLEPGTMTALTSIKQLRYLVALSDQLNFTRAAETCFVTQSTLSSGLKELEDVLGTRLVERDRQTVLMTPIGIEVATRARAILAAAQDLVEIAAGSRAPLSGLLRLGVIPTIAPFLLPPCLRRLREEVSAAAAGPARRPDGEPADPAALRPARSGPDRIALRYGEPAGGAAVWRRPLDRRPQGRSTAEGESGQHHAVPDRPPAAPRRRPLPA